MKKILSLLLITFFLSCGGTDNDSYRDENNSVPKGDPPFTPLTTSWVIDNVKVLSKEVISQGDQICQNLQNDGVAEVIVLIQNGIKHPEEYATHYGRWLGLGKKGSSTEGGNNGIVWLIRPDAKEKVTISVGRGLPKFTSSDYGKVIDDSIDYLNFHNYNKGVLKIITQTDQVVRSIYEQKQ